jgi:hypothetical protein
MIYSVGSGEGGVRGLIHGIEMAKAYLIDLTMIHDCISLRSLVNVLAGDDQYCFSKAVRMRLTSWSLKDFLNACVDEPLRSMIPDRHLKVKVRISIFFLLGATAILTILKVALTIHLGLGDWDSASQTFTMVIVEGLAQGDTGEASLELKVMCPDRRQYILLIAAKRVREREWPRYGDRAIHIFGRELLQEVGHGG